MITAKQAKAVAEMTELEQRETQISELSAGVVRCARNGMFQYETHLSLIPKVIDELKQLGYRVEEYGFGYKIYW